MASAKFEYHRHARDRMRRRKVSERQVERAIAAPDHLTPGHNDPLVAERDTAVGNTLRVVDEERDSGATAFVWTVIRIGGKRR